MEAAAVKLVRMSLSVVLQDKQDIPLNPTSCQMLGSGRPLRFELWGAHGDHSPYRLTSRRLAKDLGYTKNNTRDTRFILVQATMVV